MFSIHLQLPDEFLSSPDSFLVSICLALLIAYPFFCSLIIPFLRLGETITGSGHFPLTTDALKNVLTGHASKDVLLSIVRAVSEQPFRNQFCLFIGALFYSCFAATLT
jgi:hypothetical protein